MNLLARSAFMAINPGFDIIWTYHQKIGVSLNIVISEFMPGTDRAGTANEDSLLRSFQAMASGAVHGGLQPSMNGMVSQVFELSMA